MPTSTMKAVRLHRFGGPHLLRHEDVAPPVLAAGEVLVRVRAAGLNPPDWYAREGMPGVPEAVRPDLDLPLIPGTDVSGVVESVSEDVDGWEPGDEVMALVRFPASMQSGGYAEYVAVPAEDLARKPARMDHAQAAGLPMSGLTAWQFLVDLGHDHPSPFQDAPHVPVRLDETTTVLVNGAAGGVGHLAVQLARWRGAHVVAVASGAHEDFLRALGADEFVDYTTQDAADVVRDVDVVLDAVGGVGSGRFLRTVRRGGSLFPVYPGTVDEDESGRRGVTVTSTQVRASGSQLAELGRLVEDGRVRVEIDSRFPLEQASTAHERAGRGHIRGKIVLDVA